MNIHLLDEAQTDLHEGAQFYERQSPGLGTYFLDALFSDINSIYIYAVLDCREKPDKTIEQLSQRRV